jgi:hypothetical protein
MSREAVLDCDYWEVRLVKAAAGARIMLQPLRRHAPIGAGSFSTDLTVARQFATQILRFCDHAEGIPLKK